MNVQNEEDLLNFDMFNEGLNEDLNFLFSEAPEIPVLSNADSMAIPNQLLANPFEFNIESSVIPRFTSLARLPNSNLNMNDPTVLSLYTQLLMFQKDSKRQEFVFCNPDHFMQDTLHSLVRILGLEYEHSLCPSQVRISRPSQASYLEPGKFSHTQSLDIAYPTSSLGRTEMQTGQSISPIPEYHEAIELYSNENISMELASVDPVGSGPMNVGWISKWNPHLTEERTFDLSLTNGDLCNTFSSVSKIPTTFSFSNQSYPENLLANIEKEVLRSTPGEIRAVAPASTNIQFIFEPTLIPGKSNPREKQKRSNVSAVTEFRTVKAKRGACWKCRTIRKKCDSHEPCHVCQKGDAESIWRAIGCRRGPLGIQARSIRLCPRYNSSTNQESFSSDPDIEMGNCQGNMKDSLIVKSPKRANKQTVQGNIGGELSAQTGIYQPPAKSNQASERHLLGDRSARLNKFPIDSVHACLSTVLQHLQEKDLPWHSFQVSSSPSSLLNVPALSTFIVNTYASSKYDKLIYSTLRCLRSCLTTLKPIASNSAATHAHRNCRAKECHCENSRAIESNMSDYLNELSRILFSKTTLRGDKSWWPPVFCSLCIQSFVKKLLQALLKQHYAVGINPESGDEYLQEAVLLFTALSSGFDPIVDRNGAQSDIRSIRRAVSHPKWLSNGTNSSFQYLESIFNAQESLTTDLWKAFTDFCPGEMSSRFVGHSRTAGKSDEKTVSCIIQVPYEDPKDSELGEIEKPHDCVLKPQHRNSLFTIISDGPTTKGPTPKSTINARKAANNSEEEASQSIMSPFVEAQSRPSNPVPSPLVVSQSQDDLPSVSSIYSELDSLRSSCFNYRFENGRRYHSYQDGKYYLPNDEREQERMDMQYHIIQILLEGRKFLSPIKNPKKILDQCTGTGLWAIDIADEFIEAEVLGIDLSPIQPQFVPPNLTFQIDDVDQPWLFRPATYDFIHCSFGHGYSSKDWEFFLSESYRCLVPGGWVEIKDLDIAAWSPDDSLPETSAISNWHEKLQEGASLGGINVRASCSNFEEIFQKSGFINVKLEVMPMPCGKWPKDKKLKEVGMWQEHCFHEGLEAYSLAIFTRLLGWSLSRVHVLLAEVRSELGNREYHWYWPFFVIYGQKPKN